MNIEYCQTCGLRIRQADFESGTAVRAEEGMAFCAQCRPARGKSSAHHAASMRESGALSRPAAGQVREGRTASGSHHDIASAAAHPKSGRQPVEEPVRGGIPPRVMIGGGVGVVVLLIIGVVILNSGPAPQSQRTLPEKKTPATQPHLPDVPVLPPVGRPGDAKPPDSPATKGGAPPVVEQKPGGVEDIREGYARRLWGELKAHAEQNPGTLWVSQKGIRDFLNSYGSTAAGKEAAAYLKDKADLPPAPTPGRTIAALKADFAPEQPKTGWSYLWNAGGEIGRSVNYKPLVWNATSGTYVGDAKVYPAKGTPHHYARMASDGGHPGMGLEQKESGGIDRFVILAYCIQSGQSGKVAVSGRIACNERNGGVELRLYVNDDAKGAVLVRGGTSLDFSTWLGDLKEGDTIYVAVGPNRGDGNDTFGLSFLIYK